MWITKKRYKNIRKSKHQTRKLPKRGKKHKKYRRSFRKRVLDLKNKSIRNFSLIKGGGKKKKKSDKKKKDKLKAHKAYKKAKNTGTTQNLSFTQWKKQVWDPKKKPKKQQQNSASKTRSEY